MASVANRPTRWISGDEVRVVVFEAESLPRTFIVSASGHISVPVAGVIDVRGRTSQEVERAIAGRLRGHYITTPMVSVQVVAYRPFFIQGEVNRGGRYPFTPGLTVEFAVAIAGGYTERSYIAQARIVRPGPDGSTAVTYVPAGHPIRPGIRCLSLNGGSDGPGRRHRSAYMSVSGIVVLIFSSPKRCQCAPERACAKFCWLSVVTAASVALLTGLADARPGGGGSVGSRGVKTYTAPPTTNTAPKTAAPIEKSMTQPGKAAGARVHKRRQAWPRGSAAGGGCCWAA